MGVVWPAPDPVRVLAHSQAGRLAGHPKNVGADRELGQALAEVFSAGGALDTADLMVGRDVPKRFYYGGVDVPRQKTDLCLYDAADVGRLFRRARYGLRCA